MKKILLLIVLFISITSLDAGEYQHRVKDSKGHGVYEKIDALDQRKIVRKKKLTKEKLIKKARQELQRLVKNKKVSKTFLEVKDEKIQRTRYRLLNDWVVIYHNPKIKKTKYQNLHIFIGEFGDIKGANYSGK